MNIAIILAGGVGKRFGSKLPKQYVEINNKTSLEYVLAAAEKSTLINKIIIVMDQKYRNKIRLPKKIIFPLSQMVKQDIFHYQMHSLILKIILKTATT